jgi:hypothetical protein
MFSRNDDYGVNLRQRVSMTLNLWAQHLSLQDEIIFVDDNTPADKPTLPEEIAYSLSGRVKKLLRILRVSEETHKLFNTCLPVGDLHTRNIGIRHAQQPWIALTTVDNVAFGLYPTILDFDALYEPAAWCTFVQKVPVHAWSAINHPWVLRKLLMAWEGVIPVHEGQHKDFVHQKTGDLLILPTSVAREIRGFEEGMTGLGCAEATVMKKAQNLGYQVKSCAKWIQLFHLEHDLPGKPSIYQMGFPQNDWEEWVTNLTESRNPDTWGQYPVEEIRL